MGKADELIRAFEERRPYELVPSNRGQIARLRAKIDIANGKREGVEERFRAAARELGASPCPSGSP
jgi:hypothetical protein